MINIFSLFLMISTGISGFFWIFKKLEMINWLNRLKIKNLQKSRSCLIDTNNIYKKFIFCCSSIYNFISSMFPLLLLIFVLRSFIYEPFQIPSGSMMPTLLIGDFILVNKFTYGIKDPIYNKTFINFNHPKRGDLVVFKYPKDPKLNYIKRIIGEPGDKIIYNIISKKLTIYPMSIDGKYNKELSITYSNIMYSNFVQIFEKSEHGLISTNFIKVSDSVQNYSDGIRLIQTTETLGVVAHDILTMISPGNSKFMKMYGDHSTHLISEWIVPKDKYFVMGDNRDNSSDSRYWGFVPEKNVIGKATIIWMSLDKEEKKWFLNLKLNRVGSIQ